MTFLFTRTYKGPLQAVILDWAGTTLDYGCIAPAAVFVEVFKRRGIEMTLEQSRGPMGLHKKDHIRELGRTPQIAAQWRAIHGTAMTENDVDAIFQEFVPLQIASLAKHAELIPGTLDAISQFRQRGLKIGSTTGYTREMMEILQVEAKRRGYEPDATLCASEVPAGRPAPWMVFQNAQRLGVYPMDAIVKVGDTTADVEEGLNAGTWTIGLAKSGNELGLSEAEIKALPPDELQTRLTVARQRLTVTGAHYVVDSIADVGPLLEEINRRLANGERP